MFPVFRGENTVVRTNTRFCPSLSSFAISSNNYNETFGKKLGCGPARAPFDFITGFIVPV